MNLICIEMSKRFKAEQIVLKKFDVSKIDYSKVCLFIGKRGTGKSWCVRDIMYHCRKIPSALVVSGTERVNKFYGSHIPDIFIHENWSADLIQGVVNKQERAIEKYGVGGKGHEIMVLFDDIMFDKKWIKDKTTKALFMNGRHYKILFLVTLQYALGLPPSLRTNADYIFLFKENTSVNRKKLYEQYASVIPDFRTFCQVFDAATDDYSCLVIDNTVRSTDFRDCVFWFKASERNNFRVGNRKYWRCNDKVAHSDTYKDDKVVLTRD